MITNDQINQWKTNGYVILKNIINKELFKKCKKFLDNTYYDKLHSSKDFGSNGKLEFFSNTVLDYISINENLINCVQKLLNTEKITLIQSDAWGKYGNNNFTEQSNQDQRMHMDYGNNTFLHPPSWNNPEAVAAIVYFSNTKETSGSTAVVPRLGDNDELYQQPYINMPGQNKFKFYNNKNIAEKYFKKIYPKIYQFRKQLYEREILPEFEVGDILFYRLDIWHRGTPVLNGKIRKVMNLLWRKKESTWINNWNPGFTKKMYYGYLEKFFTKLSPLQRSTLGIPLPGDKYWNHKNINFLKTRYPGINITPYLSKL